MINQIIIKYFKFVLIIACLLVVTQCGYQDDNLDTEQNLTLPGFISRTTLPTGTIFAYAKIDDTPKQPMSLIGDQMQLVVDDLLPGFHQIRIEFEYNDGTNTPISLALADEDVDINTGDNVISFNEDQYVLPDDDNDQFDNLYELEHGSNPGLKGDIPREITLISNSQESDSSPQWSPDGSKIAFSSNRSGSTQIHVMAPDGFDPIQLTDANLFTSAQHPHWHALSNRLIFHALPNDPAPNSQIWVVDLAGNTRKLSTEAYEESFPDFNNDGTAYVYARYDRANTTTSSIWKGFTATTAALPAEQLTINPQHDTEQPDFSPDGTKIVYRSNVSGNWDIYIMDSDGGNQTALTTAPANEGHPHFNHNGTKIVFWRQTPSSNREIWTMNADGSNPVQITNHPADDGGASWGPDDNQIVFRSNRDGNQGIYIYRFLPGRP